MKIELYIPDGNRDNVKSELRDIIRDRRKKYLKSTDEDILKWSDTETALTDIITEIEQRNVEEHV